MASTTDEIPRDELNTKVFTPEIAEFAPIDFQPPFISRFGAVLIDYIILLVLPLAGLLSDRLFGSGGLGIFTDRTLWLLAVILAGANTVLLPLISGQTIGMILTGIRIVKHDGLRIGVFSVFVRQTIGYFLTLCTFGLGFLLAGVNTSGRALHDFLTGTTVVRARKRAI